MRWIINSVLEAKRCVLHFRTHPILPLVGGSLHNHLVIPLRCLEHHQPDTPSPLYVRADSPDKKCHANTHTPNLHQIYALFGNPHTEPTRCRNGALGRACHVGFDRLDPPKKTLKMYSISFFEEIILDVLIHNHCVGGHSLEETCTYRTKNYDM